MMLMRMRMRMMIDDDIGEDGDDNYGQNTI